MYPGRQIWDESRQSGGITSSDVSTFEQGFGPLMKLTRHNLAALNASNRDRAQNQSTLLVPKIVVDDGSDQYEREPSSQSSSEVAPGERYIGPRIPLTIDIPRTVGVILRISQGLNTFLCDDCADRRHLNSRVIASLRAETIASAHRLVRDCKHQLEIPGGWTIFVNQGNSYQMKCKSCSTRVLRLLKIKVKVLHLRRESDVNPLAKVDDAGYLQEDINTAIKEAMTSQRTEETKKNITTTITVTITVENDSLTAKFFITSSLTSDKATNNENKADQQRGHGRFVRQKRDFKLIEDPSELKDASRLNEVVF